MTEVLSQDKVDQLFTKILLKFVIIIVLLVVAVSAIVIAVNIMGRGPSVIAFPQSEEFIDKRDSLQYSQVVDTIGVHTKDDVPASLMVQVVFGDTSNDKTTPQEITARKIGITDFLRSYFQSKTVAELRAGDEIKMEIRDWMNENVLTSGRIKDVCFTKYEVVEQ